MLWATIVLNLSGATCLFAPSAGATTVAPTVASAGPSFPDRDTVGLWLFDELIYHHTTLTDAGEYAKADLCLMDGGTMTFHRFKNFRNLTMEDSPPSS